MSWTRTEYVVLQSDRMSPRRDSSCGALSVVICFKVTAHFFYLTVRQMVKTKMVGPPRGFLEIQWYLYKVGRMFLVEWAGLGLADSISSRDLREWLNVRVRHQLGAFKYMSIKLLTFSHHRAGGGRCQYQNITPPPHIVSPDRGIYDLWKQDNRRMLPMRTQRFRPQPRRQSCELKITKNKNKRIVTGFTVGCRRWWLRVMGERRSAALPCLLHSITCNNSELATGTV